MYTYKHVKAFDSIDNLFLLKKLLSLGVSNERVVWFKSYLSDRKQSVRIGHKLSDTPSPGATWRAPRFYTWSFVFNIYINDLSTVPDECPLESYVDDSMVYLSFSIKNIEIAEAQLANNLKKIAVYTVVLIVYLLTPRRPSFFYLGRLK